MADPDESPRRGRKPKGTGRGRQGDRARQGGKARQGDRARRDDDPTARPGWGGVARRGARQVKGPGPASEAWRQAVRDSRDTGEQDRDRGRPPAWEPEEWIDAGPVRDEATGAVARGATHARRPRPTSSPSPTSKPTRARKPGKTSGRDSGNDGGRASGAGVGKESRDSKAGGGRDGRRARLRQPGTPVAVEDRLARAAKAYERERYQDARRILAPLAERHPGNPEVRELHGLVLYRLGKWRDAIRELRAFGDLASSYEQHPVLADCHRALGRHREVAELWEELRAASPGPDLMIEGRIVAAGSLADQGDISGALGLLEQGPIKAQRAGHHHLRLWYALADLYERAGDVPRARDLFARILQHERDFVDTPERLAALD